MKGMDSAYLAAVERGDTEAAQNAKTAAGEGSGEERYQLKGSNQNKVAAGMSDEERADIIRTKNITAAVYSGQADAQIASNKTNLESQKKSLIASALKVAQKSFYIPEEITNYDFDLDVEKVANELVNIYNVFMPRVKSIMVNL